MIGAPTHVRETPTIGRVLRGYKVAQHHGLAPTLDRLGDTAPEPDRDALREVAVDREQNAALADHQLAFYCLFDRRRADEARGPVVPTPRLVRHGVLDEGRPPVLVHRKISSVVGRDAHAR